MPVVVCTVYTYYVFVLFIYCTIIIIIQCIIWLVKTKLSAFMSNEVSSMSQQVSFHCPVSDATMHYTIIL